MSDTARLNHAAGRYHGRARIAARRHVRGVTGPVPRSRLETTGLAEMVTAARARRRNRANRDSCA